MAFTPFPNESVRRLAEESNDDLYLFSTDYPHIEGGRNPIRKFEQSLEGGSDVLKDKFYSENFLRVWPDARV